MLALTLLGFWLGSQRGTDELYIRDCVDRKLANEQRVNISSMAIFGSLIGCLVIYGIKEWDFIITGNFKVNLHTLVGIIIFLMALLTLIGTAVFFTEIPRESRKTFWELKEQESKE